MLYRQDCWSIGHRHFYLEAVNYWVFKKKVIKIPKKKMLLVPGHVAFLHFFCQRLAEGSQSVSLFSLVLWLCWRLCVSYVCVLGGGEGQGCPSGFISIFKDHNRITHSFIQVRSRSLNNLFFVNKKKKSQKNNKKQSSSPNSSLYIIIIFGCFWILTFIVLYVNMWTQELLLMSKKIPFRAVILFNNQTKCRRAF